MVLVLVLMLVAVAVVEVGWGCGGVTRLDVFSKRIWGLILYGRSGRRSGRRSGPEPLDNDPEI
jgi:hypothetical protein